MVEDCYEFGLSLSKEEELQTSQLKVVTRSNVSLQIKEASEFQREVRTSFEKQLNRYLIYQILHFLIDKLS